ncbi:type IV secretory system conjugative DNA transfer family protein [Bacillus piscicola]|uniref:type IV secretory system conjugative DNA transfer family protein n=1 Tax=Bacillus piscicola TaxID=1632684 RepID=UPI001F0A0083
MNGANKHEVLKWGGSDAFTHTLIVGPTRSGKTATILKPIVLQVLEQRAKGIPAGLTVIEPKGDIVRAVKEICDELEIPYHYIDPLYPDESEALNVMKGPKTDIAEATVAVLKSMFGKQEAFFQLVQELSTRKITLLLKTLYEDDMYLIDVLRNLRNEKVLKSNVEKLRQSRLDPELVEFFENELLQGKDADKFRSLVLGLRAQLDNLMSNDYLRPLISKKSDMDLDLHFKEGGILAINTALGKLGAAGDAFGQFVAMHMQLATFRRPGTENTRIPHYLIIDEYSRYINPDVERFLSIAAEYRVAGLFAVQSLGQLEVDSGQINARAMKKAILTSCRNKIIFGGLSAEDAQEVSKEMGMDLLSVTEKRYDGNILKQWQPKMTSDREMEKERFSYSLIMDGLPKMHFIHKLLKDGTPQPPGVGMGNFIPRDPKELREHFRKVKNQTLEKEEKELVNQHVPKWQFRKFIKKQKKLAIIRKQLEEKKQHNDAMKESSSVSPVLDKVAHEENAETQETMVASESVGHTFSPSLISYQPLERKKDHNTLSIDSVEEEQMDGKGMNEQENLETTKIAEGDIREQVLEEEENEAVVDVNIVNELVETTKESPIEEDKEQLRKDTIYATDNELDYDQDTNHENKDESSPKGEGGEDLGVFF